MNSVLKSGSYEISLVKGAFDQNFSKPHKCRETSIVYTKNFLQSSRKFIHLPTSHVNVYLPASHKIINRTKIYLGIVEKGPLTTAQMNDNREKWENINFHANNLSLILETAVSIPVYFYYYFISFSLFCALYVFY